MPQPDEPPRPEPDPAQPHTWDTWQELILASAVHRHGTSAWESVAAEVKKRCSASSAALTPNNCRQKYLDLKLRFNNSGPGTVPWLEELRSIRVQELKREVERCDVSIMSLQQKVKKLKEETERPDLETEPVKTEPGAREDGRSVNQSNSTEPKPEPASNEPVGDDSCNGSSDSIEKKPVGEPVKVEPERFEGEVKENSDVLSSARRDGESDKEQSPVVKGGVDRSKQLVQVLEMVRSHKVWPAFANRFMSQDIGDKKNYVRQHLDIDTIHTRLEEGCYSDCNKKFFRDLLLLFSNSTLLFNKNTPEFRAATELHKLISLEINNKRTRIVLPIAGKPKSAEPVQPDTWVLKPKMSGPILVCRKRSSISGKATATSSGGEGKKLPKDEEKPLLDCKQPEKSDEIENTKTRSSDRVVYGSKNSKKNQNKILETPLIQTQAKGKSITKIKLKSSTLIESLKDVEISPENSKGGAENKRSSGGNGRGERKREPRVRQVKEQQSPVKRNNGRAAKKAPTPAAPAAKRSREGGDADVAASRQPKKRSRRG